DPLPTNHIAVKQITPLPPRLQHWGDPEIQNPPRICRSHSPRFPRVFFDPKRVSTPWTFPHSLFGYLRNLEPFCHPCQRPVVCRMRRRARPAPRRPDPPPVRMPAVSSGSVSHCFSFGCQGIFDNVVIGIFHSGAHLNNSSE